VPTTAGAHLDIPTGTRLCEPQQAGRTRSLGEAQTRMFPRDPLRVADPRSRTAALRAAAR